MHNPQPLQPLRQPIDLQPPTTNTHRQRRRPHRRRHQPTNNNRRGQPQRQSIKQHTTPRQLATTNPRHSNLRSTPNFRSSKSMHSTRNRAVAATMPTMQHTPTNRTKHKPTRGDQHPSPGRRQHDHHRPPNTKPAHRSSIPDDPRKRHHTRSTPKHRLDHTDPKQRRSSTTHIHNHTGRNTDSNTTNPGKQQPASPPRHSPLISSSIRHHYQTTQISIKFAIPPPNDLTYHSSSTHAHNSRLISRKSSTEQRTPEKKHPGSCEPGAFKTSLSRTRTAYRA